MLQLVYLLSALEQHQPWWWSVLKHLVWNSSLWLVMKYLCLSEIKNNQ